MSCKAYKYAIHYAVKCPKKFQKPYSSIIQKKKKKVTPSQTQTITNNNSVSKERRVFKDCKCYPISGRDLFFFPYPKEKGMESYHEAPKGTKKNKTKQILILGE